MRCYKCSFISFDYLAECKKCSVDLTATREKLGFSSVRPTEPFFLGALLKDYQPDFGRGATALAGEMVGDDLAEIELGDEAPLDLEFLGSDSVTMPGGATPAQEQMRDQLSSARKVMEEIEKPKQTTEAPTLGDDMELDLDSVLEAATTAGPGGKPMSTKGIGESITKESEIELSLEDMKGLVEGGESLAGLNLDLDLGPDTADTVAVHPDDVVLQDESTRKTEGDMVIELSSDDLDNLLEELNEVPEDKKK